MTAAIGFDHTKPALGAHSVETDLDTIRENEFWMMMMAAAIGYQLPGWAFTPSGADLAEPDYIEGVMNGGTGIKMKFIFTWSSGDLTSTQFQWDDGQGGGYATLTDGTVTNTYSGGNWTGNTSA